MGRDGNRNKRDGDNVIHNRKTGICIAAFAGLDTERQG